MSFVVHSDTYHFEHSAAPIPSSSKEMTAHTHSFHEWLYLISGDLEYMVDYRQHIAKPHTLILVKPQQIHRIRPLSRAPLNRYVLRFPDGALPETARDAFLGLGDQYVVPGTLISEEIQRMDAYVADLPESRIMDALAHQLSILIHFACNFIANRQSAAQNVSTGGQLIEYINSHLTSIHRLGDISANVHLSPSSIQKMVDAEIHKPVMAYVREQKCHLARNHLQKGFPAGDVCLQCGFSNYSTFYRAYMRTFGVAPSGDIGPDPERGG